jgi:hypothetical protein
VKTANFRGELTQNGQIVVPPEIASRVPPGEQIQIVLQWGTAVDEAVWHAAGRRRFEAAYAADDSVYELLNHAPSTR